MGIEREKETYVQAIRRAAHRLHLLLPDVRIQRTLRLRHASHAEFCLRVACSEAAVSDNALGGRVIPGASPAVLTRTSGAGGDPDDGARGYAYPA